MPPPRIILALTLRAAERAGLKLVEMKHVHRLVYLAKDELPDVYELFVFSEYYPYPWSYEVEEGLLSLMTDNYVVWIGEFRTYPKVDVLCKKEEETYERIWRAVSQFKEI